MRRLNLLVVVVASALLLAGCHIDMWKQPKKLPYQESDFFPDRMGDRQPVAGTVRFQRISLDDQALNTGYENGQLVTEFPMPVTLQMIRRGQDRFNIFCAPCHGKVGDGNGMIAARGYAVERPIASYHTERLREMPVGHFFDVITNGYGAMYQFADRIPVEDRWAIVSYIRALQLSQNATLDDAPAEERQRLLADPKYVSALPKANESHRTEAH